MPTRFLLFIFCSVLIGPVVAQTTVVSNGGFEAWTGINPHNWYKTTEDLSLEKDSIIVNEGKYSAHIVLSSKETQVLRQDSIEVYGGNSYRISMHIKDQDAAGRIRFWGYWEGHDVDGGPRPTQYSGDDADWQLYEYDIDVPAGTYFLNLEIRFYDVSSNWDGDAEFWLDNVTITALNPIKPDIFAITDSVFDANKPIIIEAQIRDDQEIQSVNLYYCQNNAEPEVFALIQKNQTVWEAVLPSMLVGERLQYWIEAKDRDVLQNTVISDTTRVIIGTIPLSFGHSVDDSGVMLYSGYKAKITGTITVPSGLFSEKNHHEYIQDLTGGINIYSDSKRIHNFATNDSVEICGIFDQIKGRSVIIPLSAELINSEARMPSFKRISCGQVNENIEGMLVEIENVTVTNWYQKADTAFLASVSDGTGNLILQILETTDIDGHSNPSNPGEITLSGIISQIDEEKPFNEGFAIIPRSWTDLSPNALIDEEPGPGKFELFQNYPNPFNPLTTIRYYLSHSGYVELTIYNTLGKVVAMPFKGRQGIGLHKVHWNAIGLAGGIYYLELKTRERIKFSKMILLK